MTRLTDEQIESYAIRLTNARRHGMSEQALLVIAEELLSEVRAARASPPPSRAPESDASGAVEWVVNDTAELGVKVGVGAMVSRGGFDAFGWACECGSQSFYVIGRSLERLFIRCNDCHRNWWVRR